MGIFLSAVAVETQEIVGQIPEPTGRLLEERQEAERLGTTTWEDVGAAVAAEADIAPMAMYVRKTPTVQMPQREELLMIFL